MISVYPEPPTAVEHAAAAPVGASPQPCRRPRGAALIVAARLVIVACGRNPAFDAAESAAEVAVSGTSSSTTAASPTRPLSDGELCGPAVRAVTGPLCEP